MRLAAAFDPRRIAGQIALLVVASVVLVHVLFTGIFLLRAPDPRGVREERIGRPLQDRFASLVRVVDAAGDPAARANVVAAINGAFPGFGFVVRQPGGSTAAPSNLEGSPLGWMTSQLRARGIVIAAHSPTGREDEPADVTLTLRDGTQVAARLSVSRDGPPWLPVVIWAAVAFVAVTFVILSFWAARALTSPLTRFSAAAEGFSVEGGGPALPETGPEEVKALSRALNRMHERIRKLVDDRTRMLAAVSHDLRTPITRLRLRAEFVGDDTIRGPMLRDLDQMNAMISGALSHLRDGQSGEVQAKVDLSSLLTTITDDFCDIGQDVTYVGPQRLVILGRADEIARAVTNLVENALKYGGSAALRLNVFPSVVEIDVADAGPGIPTAQREAMVQPFARGDDSRNLNNPAGFGLGLSILRAVSISHGGSLTLLDGETGGLVARLTLPRPPGDDTAAREPAPSRPAARRSSHEDTSA